jgi:hypothetical protein
MYLLFRHQRLEGTLRVLLPIAASVIQAHRSRVVLLQIIEFAGALFDFFLARSTLVYRQGHFRS